MLVPEGQGAGALAPELVSIEEYLGRNTEAYCAVLQETQGGSYQPGRDAGPWVRFCVGAHLDEGGRRLEQISEAGARWGFLERLVERRGWPARLAIVLEPGLFQGVDRASYARAARDG